AITTLTLYRSITHTRSDAHGHVAARVRLAYNPAHTIQGTLRITVRTVTGAASGVTRLTLVHASALTPLSPLQPALKVILPLQHGQLAGNSVLTLTAQTRPRTRVTITLTLLRGSGTEPKGYTNTIVRPLYG